MYAAARAACPPQSGQLYELPNRDTCGMTAALFTLVTVGLQQDLSQFAISEVPAISPIEFDFSNI
jgi:hypothetical protein